MSEMYTDIALDNIRFIASHIILRENFHTDDTIK